MELIKAYTVMPAGGDSAPVYEVRGRYHRRVNSTDQEGNPIRIIRKGKPRFLLIAAGNLHDALVHLHTIRPGFLVDMAAYRGELRFDNPRLKVSVEKGITISHPSRSTTDLSS
jgi:hypothetical protein